jgi:hypothetical protein
MLDRTHPSTVFYIRAARIDMQRDENWPEWYAAYMLAEQAGKELPQ